MGNISDKNFILLLHLFIVYNNYDSIRVTLFINSSFKPFLLYNLYTSCIFSAISNEFYKHYNVLLCSSNISNELLFVHAFLSLTISIIITITSFTSLQNLCLAISKPNTKRSFVK